MKPRVSVVINTLDENPRYLREAVRSCLKQDGVEIQIVISTIRGDPACTYAEALIGQGQNVVLVTVDRPGIYHQLNEAIRTGGISGDWFFCFSGNDVLHTQKCIEEVQTSAGPVRVCYSDFLCCDAQLRMLNRHVSGPYDRRRHLDGQFFYDDALMTRATLDEFAPFCEDFGNCAYWDFWLRVSDKYGSHAFAYNPEPRLYYRMLDWSQHTLRKKSVELRAQYVVERKKMLEAHR